MFRYVFYSWALAIVITLCGFATYEFITGYGELHLNFFSLSMLIIPFIASIIASPSLFISYVFLHFIATTSYTLYEKLALWYISALIAVIINIVSLAMLFVESALDAQTYFMFWPAYLATIVSISFRYKQFEQLFMTYHSSQSEPGKEDPKY
ncbi:MAG: hypothetical protein QM764_15370 [Chitinophagaceae bacterium]